MYFCLVTSQESEFFYGISSKRGDRQYLQVAMPLFEYTVGSSYGSSSTIHKLRKILLKNTDGSLWSSVASWWGRMGLPLS